MKVTGRAYGSIVFIGVHDEQEFVFTIFITCSVTAMKRRENPKGNKEIWESREMSLVVFMKVVTKKNITPDMRKKRFMNRQAWMKKKIRLVS